MFSEPSGRLELLAAVQQVGAPLLKQLVPAKVKRV
jgi:hypothetical protein